jgi:hypothetical protein
MSRDLDWTTALRGQGKLIWADLREAIAVQAPVASILLRGDTGLDDEILFDGEKAARRLSSKRNAVFLRARIAAARGDWITTERHCRLAANHPFRTQGGDGLFLWAGVLDKLARAEEAAEARRLVLERDPESEAARAIAAASAAA